MDEKYVVYWWNYANQDPYKHDFDDLTTAIKFYNNLLYDDEVGRASLRWGDAEIQGMITDVYLKKARESENVGVIFDKK